MKKNSIISKFLNYIKTKKMEHNYLKKVIYNSKSFNLDYEFICNNDNIVEGHLYDYCNMCANLNIDIARNIDSIIPINETVLFIAFCKQKLDNSVLFIAFTNYRIFVFNNNKFGLFNYNDIKVFNLIKKTVMSQLVNFNNIILDFYVNQESLNIMYSLIVNKEYRDYYIRKKTMYLCGICPVYQKLNKINSGVSIDKYNNVVFHNKKVDNYLCKYSDILNYELLENNVAVLSRRTKESSHSMKFVKKECNKMSLRITLSNNKVINIDILEQNVFGSSYLHTDHNYISNFNFVKEIFDKLDSINPDLINFYN